MDGYEATNEIRNYYHEQGVDQPIILAITGHTEETYIERALSSGMNLVLSKPVDHNVLLKISKDLGF